MFENYQIASSSSRDQWSTVDSAHEEYAFHYCDQEEI